MSRRINEFFTLSKITKLERRAEKGEGCVVVHYKNGKPNKIISDFILYPSEKRTLLLGSRPKSKKDIKSSSAQKSSKYYHAVKFHKDSKIPVLKVCGLTSVSINTNTLDRPQISASGSKIPVYRKKTFKNE